MDELKKMTAEQIADVLMGVFQAALLEKAARRKDETAFVPPRLAGRPKSPWESMFDNAIKNPVQTVAAEFAKSVGWMLLYRDGQKGMEKVWSLLRDQDNTAANWLGHRWNGIGGWAS